jgi:replication factor A1
VTIEEINDFEQARTVDTIGAITQVGTVASFQPKNGGQAKDKRSLQIVDESGMQIQVTLWGRIAANDNFKVGDILAIRSARVSDYGGKSLNASDEHTQLYINLDHKRAEKLRKWYDENPEER